MKSKTVTLVECARPNWGLFDLFYRGEPVNDQGGPYTRQKALSVAVNHGFTHYTIDPASMLPPVKRTKIRG